VLRVALWCAVSSRPQADTDKASLPAQEAAGRQFAERIGGAVVVVYTVPGHTRDIVLWQDAEREMPAYRELREDCERRAFDVLHAVDMDRLGRHEALAYQVIGLVEKAGAEIYLASAPHTIGETGTAQRYIYAIAAARSQEDISRLRSRLDMGMRRRVSRGLPPHSWPYGYRRIRDDQGHTVGAEHDPDTAPAVRLITRLFLAGATYNDIARELERAGYPTRQGHRWDSGTVRRMLHSDTYAGFPHFGDTQAAEPSSHYEPFWDAATWAAVKRERRNRYRDHRRTKGCPLHKVAVCARCGSTMARYHKGRPYYYLRCGRRRTDVHGPSPCNHSVIREELVLAEIGNWLEQFITLADVLAYSGTDARTDLQQRMQDAAQRVDSLQQQRHRLALALAASKMDVDVYHNADASLRIQLDAAQEEYERLEVVWTATPEPGAQFTALTGLRDLFVAGALATDPLEMNERLRSAGIRVYVDGNKVVKITIE